MFMMHDYSSNIIHIVILFVLVTAYSYFLLLITQVIFYKQ